MWRRGRNKYGAVKKEYNGRVYHSKGEANYARELDLRKRAGEIAEITPQFRLSLDVNGVHICNYICDFMVVTRDGEKQLHEYKGGIETDSFKLKWQLCRAIWGNKYKMILIK